jgi:hypothetical protein
VAAMKILGPLRLDEGHPVAVNQGRVVTSPPSKTRAQSPKRTGLAESAHRDQRYRHLTAARGCPRSDCT